VGQGFVGVNARFIGSSRVNLNGCPVDRTAIVRPSRDDRRKCNVCRRLMLGAALLANTRILTSSQGLTRLTTSVAQPTDRRRFKTFASQV
jgi:hypothetical protein